MKMLRQLLYVSLVGILLATLPCFSCALGQWNIVGTFDQPFDCGFFFDASTGLIGSGNGANIPPPPNSLIEIQKTTNGGTSWYPVITPAGVFGAVTDIFMKSTTEGYATIFDFGSTSGSDLWKTTDGGESWSDLGANIFGKPTCVYATSSALTVTEWFDKGGSSTNDGRNFTQYFGSNNSFWSNGIDFSNDLMGVATMREPQGSTNPFYYTTDGGITWLPSSIQVEAWSVYGKKCTPNFFCASEGDERIQGAIPGRSIYWSSDGGKTWATRYTFSDPTMEFTGHIAGSLNTLYLQTDTLHGMFRSDDLGQSWKAVAGPTNHRDTRFVVTGTAGEVVYAFDTKGNVWKTITGGDGTLMRGTNGVALALPDSALLTARECKPDTVAVVLSNSGCADLTIDSLQFSPNTLGEFSGTVITTQILPADSGTLQLVFTPHNANQHISQLRIFGHSANGSFDTVMQLTGMNLSVIEPIFGTDQSAFVADTLDVPVYLNQTNDPFNISSIALTLDFNGDVLTPVGVRTGGTLTAGAQVTEVVPTFNTCTVNATLTSTLTQPTTDFTKPLLIFRFYITLAKAIVTPISVTNIEVNNSSPLALCSTASENFSTKLRCGDSTIRSYLLGTNVGKFLSVTPNPVTQNQVTIRYRLSTPGNVSIELLDSKGVVLNSGMNSVVRSAGLYQEELNSATLPSGAYFLQLRVNGVVTSQYKLVRE